ncbi:hypothetical protein A9Q99_23210 [Gammaproteobacteria bacterium 45_16_T64]|nr:hypothetical protein A9Q99_23210 [Gammaproteobacteria bacterium 45_16_T64]
MGAAPVHQVSISTDINRHDINPSLVFFEDTKGQLSFSDVYQDRRSIPWLRVPNGMPSFGFSTSTYWIYASLDIDSTDTQWYLNVDNSQLRKLDVYLIESSGKTKVFQTGDRFEFSGRPLQYRTFLFPLDVSKRGALDVLVRIESPYPLRAPLFIVEKDRFLQDAVQTELAYGVLFGFLVVMAIYNFFIFLATQEVSYLFYVFFTISSALFLGAELGFTFQYLWPSAISWQQHSVGVLACLTMLFSGLFVLEFLQLRVHHRILHFLLWVFVIYSIVMLFVGFMLTPFYLQQINSAVVLLVGVLVPVASVIVWRKGQKEAGYLAVAGVLYVMGIMIMIAHRQGLIPSVAVSRYTLEIGSALELTLLSFALADKLKRKNSQRLILDQQARDVRSRVLVEQEFALERERVSNERLEKNVKVRTERLHQALAELTAVNHKLEEMSTIDSITGLKNQTSFFERLKEEWERAYRDQTPVALLLVSIDRYDSIGDCYGHVAAEESLKVVGQMLRALITRPADVVARVEIAMFGAVLPNTEKEGIEHLALEIETKLKSEPINLGVCCISVSVGCGAAVMVPQEVGDSELLLDAARVQLGFG